MEAQTVYKPFHHAVPSNDLAKSKEFYGAILQCQQGRIDPIRWIDYNFFGSQLVTHFATPDYIPATYIIDGIPVPSFGADLTPETYSETKAKLDNHSIKYEILPKASEAYK
jgi:extradiol dioxygenase family protein